MAEEKPLPVKDRPIGSEEALARTLLELTDPKKFEFFSELDDEEILVLSALKTWGDKTGFKVINDFCDYFLKHRVSRYRQGRREIALAVGLASGGIPARTPKSLRTILSGLRI